MRKLKERTIYVFEKHCKTGLLTMRFHHLDHIFAYWTGFGSVIFLDLFAHEHFNVDLKRSNYITCIRRLSTIEETSHALESMVQELEGKGR